MSLAAAVVAAVLTSPQQLDLATIEREGSLLSAIEQLGSKAEHSDQELHFLGYLHERAGQHEDTAERSRELLGRQPGHAAARLLLARSLWYQGTLRAAAGEFDRLLAQPEELASAGLDLESLTAERGILTEEIDRIDRLRPARSRLGWLSTGAGVFVAAMLIAFGIQQARRSD